MRFIDFRNALKRSFSGLAGHARTSRRRMLAVCGLVLLRPGILWAQTGTASGSPAAEMIAAVCDCILPAHGRSPGALALGIEAHVLEIFSASGDRGGNALDAIIAELDAKGFLLLDRTGRDEILERYLTGEVGTPASFYLRMVKEVIVERYYSNPEAWAALAYRQPQPLGYPDYDKCSSGSVTHDAPG